jgi:PKD repeat protein
MKPINKILSGLFLLILVAGQLTASGSNKIFTGSVTSSSDQTPLAFYDVYFQINDDSLFCYPAITDDLGVYYEILETNPGDMVTVYVFDCEGIKHSIVFPNPDTINIADFSICSEAHNCQAMFYEETDTLNPLACYFHNASVGSYNITAWDFNDGTFSYEENPYHIFPAEGIYIVSLTIYDSINTNGCFDFISLPVYIGEPGGCYAGFSFTLDSLNNTPNVYNFINQSEGENLTYYWDFGDGQYSNEKNPQHIYSESGTYQVYLRIQNTYGSCFDETAQTLSTPSYYDFGGQAFLGQYPINIEPEDNQNSAVAYLYRKVEGKWRYMDKREFWQLGYYWFTDKLEGDYLIRIDLDKNSEAYGEYAPGYYKHAAGWLHASTFTLSGETYEESVKLTKLSAIDEGINQLSGIIFYDSTLNNRKMLAGALIQLLNQSREVVKFTYSDEQGNFKFDDLPDGSYYIKGEVTGYCSSLSPVTLTSGTELVDDIEIEISECGTIGIDETKEQKDIEASLFPVPAQNTLNIELKSNRKDNVTIFIVNMEGKTITRRRVKATENNTHRFDVSKWPDGIYFVNILNINNGRNFSKKFIISR